MTTDIFADRPTQILSENCPSCDGTGIYTQGMAEGKGAAVVCSRCKGTGEYLRVYVPFEGKQTPPANITRVYSHNASVELLVPTVPGGVSIQEWQDNPDSAFRPGTEVRTGSCPLWWFSRGMGKTPPPNWQECVSHGPYTRCPSWENKKACWERWDTERATRN